MPQRPPRSPLFPSTPLFRSDGSLTTRLTNDALGNYQPSWSTGATAAPASAHTIQLTVLQPGERPLAGVKLTLSGGAAGTDRKSTRLNSSHANISYAVFCLQK